ncbi:hypothetical protein SMA5143A_4516 [Streptomyces sp. MA5143a]|nr:hypothetical protein SMA5143A_4516 [Streptomyces sp. MA5143a]
MSERTRTNLRSVLLRLRPGRRSLPGLPGRVGPVGVIGLVGPGRSFLSTPLAGAPHTSVPTPAHLTPRAIRVRRSPR